MAGAMRAVLLHWMEPMFGGLDVDPITINDKFLQSHPNSFPHQFAGKVCFCSTRVRNLRILLDLGHSSLITLSMELLYPEMAFKFFFF